MIMKNAGKEQEGEFRALLGEMSPDQKCELIRRLEATGQEQSLPYQSIPDAALGQAL